MKYEVVEPPNYPAIARELDQSRGVFLDTETTVSDLMFGHKLLGFAVSRGERDATVYYIPVNHHQYHVNDLELRVLFQAIEQKPLFNHNIKFDLHRLAEHGFKVERDYYYDTIVAARLYERGEHPKLGLADLAWGLLHYRYEHNLKSQRKNLEEFLLEEVAAYCSEDVWVDRRLYYWLMGVLSPSLTHLFKRESRLTRDLFDSEQWGLYIDQPYLKAVTELLDGKMADSLQAVRELNDLEEFNPRSPKQVAELFEHHKIPVVKQAKKGPSWNKDAMLDARKRRAYKAVAKEGQLTLQNVGIYRVLSYLRSGIVEKANQYVVLGSETYHGEFKNWGTVTGRLSSDLQQMVKGWLQMRPDAAPGDPITFWEDESWSDQEISARRMFRPRPGYFLLRPDYSQIEMWILGFFMKDPVFQRWLESGDVHAAAALEVWKIGPDHEMAKKYRARGKEFNFSCVYGVGDHTLSGRLGCSREQAKAYRMEYYQHMPGYNRLYRMIRKQLRNDNIIRNVYGREYMLDEALTYKGVNYITQGSAGDFVKFRLPDTRELRRQMGVKTANTTHDDFWFEVPYESAGGVPDLIAALRPSPFGRELDVDVEWSTTNFVDLHKWDENTEAKLVEEAA